MLYTSLFLQVSASPEKLQKMVRNYELSEVSQVTKLTYLVSNVIVAFVFTTSAGGLN